MWNTTNTNDRNDWSKSTLQEELNTTYLNSIDEISRNYIDTNYVWKLGGASGTEKDWTPSNMYNYERSNNVYSGNAKSWQGTIGLAYASDFAFATSYNNCNATMGNWDVYSPYQNCRYTQNNWMWPTRSEWIISTVNSHSNRVFAIDYVGKLVLYGTTQSALNVRPTVFLKGTVKIIGGTGTTSDPYTLGI